MIADIIINDNSRQKYITILLTTDVSLTMCLIVGSIIHMHYISTTTGKVIFIIVLKERIERICMKTSRKIDFKSMMVNPQIHYYTTPTSK